MVPGNYRPWSGSTEYRKKPVWFLFFLGIKGLASRIRRSPTLTLLQLHNGLEETHVLTLMLHYQHRDVQVEL